MKKSFSLFLTAMFLSTAASMNSLAADSNDVSSHADLSNIQNDLSVLSDSFRPIGSLGEQNGFRIWVIRLLCSLIQTIRD